MIFAPLSSPTAAWLEQHHPVLREALAWIRNLPPCPTEGVTELRGSDLYVNVHGYATVPEQECRWESHRHTIDVQYCIAGGEIIDWLPAGALQPRNDYVEAKDTEFWHPSSARPSQLVMTPGAFALFLPGELHRPKGRDGTHATVSKLVVKIHAPLFLEHAVS
jgi:YhcH/YjgK/YiaL family protein